MLDDGDASAPTAATPSRLSDAGSGTIVVRVRVGSVSVPAASDMLTS